MKKNILDFRNILDLEMVKKFEFKYQRIGTKINKY